jgi:hypothetical protein
MWCADCKQRMEECACPDRNVRLRSMSDSPHIISRWCLACDKHYSQCKCTTPVWGMRSGGQLSAGQEGK